LIAINHPSSENRSAHLEVRLTDSPGDFEAVNIDIQDVLVNVNNDSSTWVSLGVTESQFDLLTLTNGISTILASAEVPAGKLNQIRLVLGTENRVVVDGLTYPLATPGAQHSGLKIKLSKTLTEGVITTVLLDFDAKLSVVKRGNDNYMLKPVIRAVDN
jgi:hypothetical protein